MSSERINGCRVNFDTCTTEELQNMQGYIGERLIQNQSELLLVQVEIDRRNPPEVQVV